MRAASTDAERRIWYYLRARRFAGFKFRRQVPLGPYIADFLCEDARVIIEVDGGQHAERIAADELRTRWLQQQGYRVLRYWNNDVMENVEGVLTTVLAALVNPLPGPLPRERENSE